MTRLCTKFEQREPILISFTLNGTQLQVTDLPPTTTLLQYLRDQPHLTGTKEGCAEGDCGACTVVILDHREPSGASWRSVNSCLVLLPMLHGKQVYTVEGLSQGADHTRSKRPWYANSDRNVDIARLASS